MNNIINPINNQKVSIFSKQGKNILKNYVKNFKIYTLKGGMNTTDQTQIEFSVMQFNIWQEGVNAQPQSINYGARRERGLREIALAIAEFKPDFVCISENRNPGFLHRLCIEIQNIDNDVYSHTREDDTKPRNNDTGILSKYRIESDIKLITYDIDEDIGSVTKD